MTNKQKVMLALAVVMVLSLFGCTGQTGPGITDPSKQPSGDSIVSDGYGYADEPRYDWQVPEGSFTYHNSILYIKELGAAAGPDSLVPTNGWGVCTTDLGFPTYDSENKRMYFLWGDTYSHTGNSVYSGVWTSSAILYTDNLDFSKGILYAGALEGRQGTLSATPITKNVVDRKGNAELGLVFDDKEVTGSLTEVWSNIPTGGVVINGTIYVFYMEVGRFGTSSWDTYSGRVVKSTDGKTWEPCEELIWQGKDEAEIVQNAANFNQMFPYDDGEYIYIYGIPGGRLGGIKLARVRRENIEQFQEYEYFTGYEADGITPVWVKGTEGLNRAGADNYLRIASDESYVLKRANIGEVCVFYNAYLQKYLMTYFTNAGSTVNMHYSETPYGPWSEDPIIICKTGDVGAGYGLYAGLSHQMMSTNSGQRIFMIVSETSSRDNTDGYIPRYIEIVFRYLNLIRGLEEAR